MSYSSSTSSALYFFKSSFKTWYTFNEDVAQFLHPYTLNKPPLWWAIFLEVFQFIQFISFGFEATTAGSDAGYYISLPRAFFKFNYGSYVSLFWSIMAVNIFMWLLLFKQHWRFRTGLKQTKINFTTRLISLWVNNVIPLAYLPMLFITLRSVTCNNVNILAHFKDEKLECWSGNGIVVMIGVLLCVATLVCFSVIRKLTEIRFVFKDKGVFMTPYVYQTLFYLLSITLFAFLSEALWLATTEVKNIILSIVMAVCTAAMVYVTILRLPYIKIWDNCIRTAMYTSLCWFAICDFIGTITGAEKALLITFGAGVIPVSLAALKYCHYRAFQLYWNKEVFDFQNPYEIEIAVRVCYGSCDPDHISIAQDLLQNASDRFPSTTVVYIAKCLIIINQLIKDDHPALSGLIDRACKESRNPSDIYLAHSMKMWKRFMFKKTGVEADIKRHLRNAEHASKRVVTRTRSFWKLLLHGGDLSTTGLKLVSEIEEADSRAERIYKHLISHYPHSSEVLRHYAQFLREVRMDNDTSRAMLDLADYVEDKNTKNMTSKLSASIKGMEEGQSSTSSKGSQKRRVVRKREKYKRKSTDSLGSLTFTTSTMELDNLEIVRKLREDPNAKRVTINSNDIYSDEEPQHDESPKEVHQSPSAESDVRHVSGYGSDSVSTKDAMQLTRYRSRISNSRSSAVKNLKIVILLTFIVLVGTMILTFVSPLVLTNRHYGFMSNMPLVSGRTVSTTILRLIREINIATTLGLDSLASHCREDLSTFLTFLRDFIAHYKQPEYSVLQRTWAEDDLVLREYIQTGSYSSYQNVTTNLYFAVTQFSNKAHRMLALDSSEYLGKMNNTDFMWIIYNCPTTIIPALTRLSDNYASITAQRLDALQDFLIYILVASGGFYLIVLLFFFIFPYRAINKERAEVTKLFLSLPRSTVHAIYDRLVATEESGEESDYERAASFSLKLPDFEKYSKLKTGSMRIMSIRFVALIVAIYAISVAIFLIFDNFVNNYGSIGADISHGTTVRFKTQALGFYANELIFNYGPYTRDEIRDNIKTTILQSRHAEYSMDFETHVDGGKPRLLRSDNYSSLLTSLIANVSSHQHNFYPSSTVLPEVTYQIAGLFDYLAQFWSWCEQLSAIEDSTLSFENYSYRSIAATIVGGELDQWLSWQITWLPNEYESHLRSVLKAPILIFCLGFLVLFVGFVYIYPLTNQIEMENARTTRMLLFIPLDIINRTPAVKEYLSSGQVSEIKHNLMHSAEEIKEKTKTILEGTTDAVIIIDNKGNIDYFNNAAERLFEYRRDEAMAEGAYNVLPASLESLFQRQNSKYGLGSSNDSSKGFDKMSRVASRGHKSNMGTEVVCKTRNGKDFPALISFSNYEMDDKDFTAVFVRDISDLVTQRKRADDVMRLILPASVAEHLKRDPDRIIAQYYKSVTVLFADICNFTELSSRIEAFPMVAQLNHLFSMWDIMVEKHRLEKIKTVGDAIMVVGGAPEEMENHAEAVFLFAKDMFVALKSFNMQYSQNWQIRIGINSGPAVAGVVGKKKITYDLWSDDVNIASRMESTGVPGHIQVSANTYELIKDKYQSSEIRTVDAKGKGKMVAYLFPP